MNPKTPQDLDPKLKEAYERVMGGNFTPPLPQAPNPVPPAENPAPIPPPTAGPAQPLAPLPNPMPPLNAMSPSSTPATGENAASANNKSKFSPKLFLIAGIAFFLVYALVWGKLFNLF